MNIRHWLIKKLACGDMIMINFERRWTGSTVPANLGPVLISNVSFEAERPEQEIAVALASTAMRGGSVLSFLHAVGLRIEKCRFRGWPA
jgi:hypothetical protein